MAAAICSARTCKRLPVTIIGALYVPHVPAKPVRGALSDDSPYLVDPI
jgi:hypothetical protein